MPPTIEVVELPKTYAAIARAKTSPQAIGNDMGHCVHQVMAYMQQHAVQPAGAPICFYFEMESDTVWNIGAGFPVGGRLEGAAPVEVVEVPEGRYVTLLHVGPYRELGAAWKTLEEWYAAQGYTIDMASLWCWESYLTDPATEPDEANFQTRLYWKL